MIGRMKDKVKKDKVKKDRAKTKLKSSGHVCPYCFEDLPAGALRKICRECVMKASYVEYPASEELCPQCRRTLETICRWKDGDEYMGCGSILPHMYTDVPTRIIAMAGAKETGKSQYIDVILKRMSGSRIGGNLGLSFEEDEFFSTRKTRESRNNLENKKTTIETDKTKHDVRSNDDPSNTSFESANANAHRQLTKKEPLVSDPYIYKVTGNNSTEYLVLYDTAGEALEDMADNPGDVEQRLITMYMKHADAVLFFVDPLQIPNIRKNLTLPVGFEPQQKPTLVDRNWPVLLTVIRLTGPNTRMCLALTKVDLLIKEDEYYSVTDEERNVLFPPSCPVRRAEDDIVLSSEIDAISEFVRDYLLEKKELDMGNVVTTVQNRFQGRHKFFAISSLGEAPIGRTISPEVKPLRVDDPIIWILRNVGSKLVPRERR